MIEDNPEWQVYKNLIGLLYRSSPARVPVAGSVESIAGITAQTLYDCHKAFYTPGNMCLTVVGDVDPQEVLRLAREVLPAGSGPAIPRDYGEEEDLTRTRRRKPCAWRSPCRRSCLASSARRSATGRSRCGKTSSVSWPATC